MPELTNMLAWWQWLILAAVPPAIVALYFLKLRRRPLEVPSTYLWHKSMEDLHVNTIWQRLRRNLLLLLQLLLVLLAIVALVRPHWRAMHLSGNRFILLVDNSASMQATDVAALAAGGGQAPRRRTDRPDEFRRRGHGHQLCRHGAGGTIVHRRPPAAAGKPGGDPAHAAVHLAAGGPEGGLRAGQSRPQRRGRQRRRAWPWPCRRSW